MLPLAAPARPPNVVVVLADDLGYGDVQCYNPARGKIATPAIDGLAAQGMRFTDGHSSSGVCSPSRYTLLTGRYHWRTRLQNGIVGEFGPPLIAPDRLTIAGLAKQHGYHTACIGKWHLGWDWARRTDDGGRKTADGGRTAAIDYAKPIAGGPTTRGFDSYFGTDVPNWPPYCFIENDRTVGQPTEPLPKALLGNNLASKPGPMVPGWRLEEILPSLERRACDFIAGAAAKPEPFLLYMPLTAPHTPLAVAPEWRGRSGLGTYADFVMQTDATVGRVLEALDRSGAASNTLVFFTSDNGCAPYIGVPEMEKRGHFPSGPLRGYKSSVWEGGHRVPFVARWPGVVAAGTICTQLVHQADLLATLADVLGAKLPENAGEDSFSLLPLLRGGDQPTRSHAISCGANGVPGLRSEGWKYIPGKAPQLYHLAADVAETNNLAAAEAARVNAMRGLLEKLITDGRSTPGPKQRNDVTVKRHES
jgi:arylsulfatase A